MVKDYAKASNKSSRRRKKPQSARGKNKSLVLNFNPMLLLVIVVGGLFGGSIFYIEYIRDLVNKLKDFGSVTRSVSVQANKTEKAPVVPKEVTTAMPKFEFYRTLPKMEVAIDKTNDKIKPVDNSPINTIAVKSSDNILPTAENKPQDKAAEIASNKPDPSKSANVNVNVNVPLLSTKPAANSSAYVLQLASFKEMRDAEQLKAKLILAGFNVSIQSIKLANGEVWHRVKTSQLSDLALAQDINDKLKEHNIKGIVLTEKLNG